MPADTVAKMYIAGDWRDASDGRVMDVLDPATEEVIATTPVATPSDVDAALAAVEKGWSEWRETDAWTRSAKLRLVGRHILERTEEFAAILTAEQGSRLPRRGPRCARPPSSSTGTRMRRGASTAG